MREALEKVLINSTLNVSLGDSSLVSTHYFSEKCQVDRTTASQYLNELVAEGKAIKVNTRPVLFFHLETLRQRCDNQVEFEKVYPTANSFWELLKQFMKKNDVFKELIGSSGSLSHVLEKSKSAVTYPNGGLPILLLGATGVGKSLIAQKLFEYGQSEGLYGENSRFLAVNCSEYADNPQFFLTHIFGNVKGAYTGAESNNDGLVNIADKGILFLDEIHCLTPECQEKLYHFMDKGTYQQVGDNTTVHHAQVQLIFATSEDPEIKLLKPLMRRIPITLKIPSLDNRPVLEKKELVYRLFLNEAKRINQKISLTKRVYQVIVDYHFSGNVGQLVNCLKVCTASALMTQLTSKDSLEIDINHLPDYIIRECALNGSLYAGGSTELIPLDLLEIEYSHNKNIYAFNQLLIQIGLFDGAAVSSELEVALNKYIESVCFEENQTGIKELLYTGFIQSTCQKLLPKYQVTITNDDTMTFSKLLSSLVATIHLCADLATENQLKITKLKEDIHSFDRHYYQLTLAFCEAISRELAVEITELGFINLYLFIKKFILSDEQKETRAIVLCHGFSTASSIKNTANQLLGNHIFDALDMPIEMEAKAIAEKLSDYVNDLPKTQNLIILVDMGSLEAIHQNIKSNKQLTIALFNNVTMKLVLDIGFKLIANESISSIVETIDQNNYRSHSVFVENKRRDKCLIFTSPTGISMADKIKKIIQNSLPTEIDLLFDSEDYDILLKEKEKAAVFRDYIVTGVIGTTNPDISNQSFYPIEDFIQLQDFETLVHIFGDYLSGEQIQRMADNILKYFSQDNLVENLTILNPEKIVRYVEEILDYLQKKLDVPFDSRVIVGLYIHISCLIERLITEKYITSYDNLAMFEATQNTFIQIVGESFTKLEKDYCVEIPTSEIAYLYDYIYKSQ
ncbi:sigma 54-interacting transcriptional regulator [Vagococcus sp. BWB3-3]|uniref:Sigma 54-interacting transcriptional regulator n=1 Tax=Vagococcus allomyrinae TaxID=2794353 RepID=A0A940SWD8_9ENTE|nr:sigma 54-interacting transcriptional regulator [Vagococcus allomyrinae]MBP1042884.1 sigma 54-interacting transcriptional regulator [Vagococcus allomyrinae]